ncbi:MAG: transcriptional regulator [Desulfovibrionaceae bacterium]|nr:transcriptional regulator [Desulfovibrionaceae bacterium]MDD4952471.1 transcriptional regulator [Desulfovibrionaceae bacterium]
MIKYLIVIAAAVLLWKLFKGDKKHKELKKDKVDENLIASGDMVKDPVCGTYVPSDGDIRVREGDKVHVFCSYECRDKYIRRLEAGQGDSDKQA